MRTPSTGPISRLFLLFAVAVRVVSPTTEQASFHKSKGEEGTKTVMSVRPILYNNF